MLYLLFCFSFISLLCLWDRCELLLLFRKACGSLHFHLLFGICLFKILPNYSGQHCYLLSKKGSAAFWINVPESDYSL